MFGRNKDRPAANWEPFDTSRGRKRPQGPVGQEVELFQDTGNGWEEGPEWSYRDSVREGFRTAGSALGDMAVRAGSGVLDAVAVRMERGRFEDSISTVRRAAENHTPINLMDPAITEGTTVRLRYNAGNHDPATIEPFQEIKVLQKVSAMQRQTPYGVENLGPGAIVEVPALSAQASRQAGKQVTVQAFVGAVDVISGNAPRSDRGGRIADRLLGNQRKPDYEAPKTLVPHNNVIAPEKPLIFRVIGSDGNGGIAFGQQFDLPPLQYVAGMSRDSEHNPGYELRVDFHDRVVERLPQVGYPVAPAPVVRSPQIITPGSTAGPRHLRGTTLG